MKSRRRKLWASLVKWKELKWDHSKVIFYRSYIDHSKCDSRVLQAIKGDVKRTFQNEERFKVPEDDSDFNYRRHPLCNILVAYAFIDQTLGYTQGK